ncbi:MAG: cytochrome c oxidase subunit [Actinomycetota bacterium]|jgi:plastocyanin
MSWGDVARVCAGSSAAVAFIRGVAVGDREAMGIGVALAVATALTFVGRRVVATLGWIGLAALLVNQAFWMIPATLSLTGAAPSTIGAASPAFLSIAAILGLVASALRPSARAENTTRATAVGAAAVVVALVVAVPALGADAAKRRASDLVVVTRDVKFKPERLTTPAGDIGVVVKNDDLFWHTFTVSKLDANVTVATSGRKRLVIRDAAPGTYKFVCAIPGHESAGMKGTLVVTP